MFQIVSFILILSLIGMYVYTVDSIRKGLTGIFISVLFAMFIILLFTSLFTGNDIINVLFETKTNSILGIVTDAHREIAYIGIILALLIAISKVKTAPVLADRIVLIVISIIVVYMASLSVPSFMSQHKNPEPVIVKTEPIIQSNNVTLRVLVIFQNGLSDTFIIKVYNGPENIKLSKGDLFYLNAHYNNVVLASYVRSFSILHTDSSKEIRNI